jgi:phage shock protein PspC (stress-responsive transcriptional regulator)
LFQNIKIKNMNKVININFQGRILPIEENAYEILKEYIASLQVYFANEEGKDEIINDIECRVAELCDERLKKGEICINDNAIQLIINSIGRPADFEALDGFEQTTSSTKNTTTSNNTNNSKSTNASSTNNQKRLYRDEHNKILGGVCSGVANYFGLDPVLVRVLWIFLLGVNVLGYLILWIAVPSSSVKEVGGIRKRLFRDIDNKLLGGVCAGLSKYFGVRVGIIRLLFMIPFINFIFNFRHFHLFQFWESPDFPNFIDITFSPGALFVYIVLWLVLPEAKTSADKLQMVGEKVDLNSIKNTIQNDMEGFGKRAKAWGSELYRKSKANPNTNKDVHDNEQDESQPKDESDAIITEKNTGPLHFIGKFIGIAIKIFVYFIVGIIGFSLLVALFGIGVATTSVLPLKGFLLEDGMQSFAAIGTILFFVWVPVIAIVTAVIRRIAGYKKSNRWVRISFISLWTFGWICLFYFISSVGNSFSKHNVPTEQNIILTSPKVNVLEVTSAPNEKYYEEQTFELSPFDKYSNEDTLYVRNLRIRIIQSTSDSFQIKVVKLSNGKTTQQANELASNINFNIKQVDSLLYLDKGIAIHKNYKFRNQHLIMTIAVPIGKRIKINDSYGPNLNVNFYKKNGHAEFIKGVQIGAFNTWNASWDKASFPYEKNITYTMTTNGLIPINQVK